MQYRDLLEKVHKRLAGWKMNSLSLADRVTLATSTLPSIPIYATQTAKLPQAVLYDLDKHTRRCIWGSNDTRRGIHLVQWPTYCKLKDCGGLGLKQSAKMNQALLTKLAWRFINEPNSVWSRLLRAKYGSGREWVQCFQPKARASHIWRGMVDSVAQLGRLQ